MARATIAASLVALAKRTTKGYSTTAAVTGARSRARSTVDSTDSGSNNKTSSPSAHSPSSSWVPDPVTGYYRPGNRCAEIDAAAMRESMLSQHKSAE